MTDAERQQQDIRRFPLVEPGTPGVPALVAIIRRLSVAHSLQEIMETVTHAARGLLQADGITFVLREGELCYYAEEDAISPLWKGKRFPMSACISGWCMMERKPAVVPDITQDERIPQDAYKPTFVESLVMVPVRQDDPIAAIGAYWAKVREIRAEEVDLLQTVANAAALALSKLELEMERERVRKAQSEISHRLKNMLAVIDAVSRQTLRTTDSPEEFTSAFSGRLRALSRAQALLDQWGMTGADLRRLLREQLVIDADDSRIRCVGPEVFLPANEAFDLGLVLHELGTNARKYGALSCDDGSVTIEWQVAAAHGRRTLALCWTERNGPTVSAPSRNGFGSTLLRLAFRRSGGETKLRYEPGGVTCAIRIPLP